MVITVEGPEGRQRAEIDKPFARLGSHELSEVTILDEDVSRQWLYFHATDDGVFCVDLTRDESTTSRPPGWLCPDDCLELGLYRIWAQLTPSAAGETQAPGKTMADLDATGTAAEPQPVLVLAIGGKEIARRAITRELTVLGRRTPSTLQITSRSVSATHCVLYWKSGVLWVVDLFSTKGTRLQGRPIEVAWFSPTASLQIGRAEFHHLEMFEKLPDGDEAEPAESPPLAGHSGTQREEFDAEVAAWMDRRKAVAAELDERAERLTAAYAELDSREFQWEEARQREEAELAARKSQLDEMASALDKEKSELATFRQQYEEGHRDRERAMEERVRHIDEASAALAGDNEQFEAKCEAWEEERRRIDAEQTDRSRQLAREEDEFLLQREECAAQTIGEEEEDEYLPQREEWAAQTLGEEGESKPGEEVPESASVEPLLLSFPDDSPRLAALPTIRWGPEGTPTDHSDELRPTVAAFWVWTIIVAVACSGITFMAVKFYPNRLPVTVLGTALGMFVPIALAAVWRRRRTPGKPDRTASLDDGDRPVRRRG